MKYLFITSPLLILLTSVSYGEDWPQAAGPNHNYQVKGNAVTGFSVSRNENVLWKSKLPNTGESAPVIANGKIFLTCHTEMKADAESGRDILGICFDAATGRELWRRTLPGSRTTDMASGFSDNTAASPVTDGKFVCFINVGGSILTYDFEGHLIWKYDWVPFGRHHARQQEPILHDGKVIVLKTVAEDLPIEATTKSGAKPLGRDLEYWTRLHAFDLATGNIEWVAEAGTSVHSASLLNFMADGTATVLTGRGGGHQPPEEPYGLSMISADTGRTIWDLPIKGYAAHQNAVWDVQRAPVFVGMQHYLADVRTGALSAGVSLSNNVTIRHFQDGRYVTTSSASLPRQKRQKPTTYHTNILAGDYHYFRTHHGFYLGRIHVGTGKVEYLQVPVQVVRESAKETLLWDKARPNEVRNNDGFVVYQDKRATLSGWGHVSAASPIIVGDYLFIPTMVGTVYVLKWNVEVLDEDALVFIGDLGAAGKTWSLSSLSFADGRLYARTMKELICVGDE